MLRLSDRIETIAQSDAPVLITGESGTGKELVARTLHDRSTRRNKPFIAVNCAAFPETLLEAELFGHERGRLHRRGEAARRAVQGGDGGTLLLDEIAEVPLPAQAKLLRVLQEGTVEPLGTNESTKVDVRIISATHRNLRERIKEGRFREDLYYRLNVLDIEIPAAARAPRRSAAPAAIFSEQVHPARQATVDDLAARLGGALPVSTSRATCASSPTPSSTPWCWPAAARSRWSTSPAASPARWTEPSARRPAPSAP